MQDMAGSERTTVQIELSYDRLATRLRAIGDVPVTYEVLGSRPSRVGAWLLGYDMLGGRLRCVGDLRLTYDSLGSRARTLGDWTLAYDRLGARLCAVGPYELTFDHLGSRVRSVGELTLEYGRLGHRPVAVDLPAGATALTSDDVLALFFVLFVRQRAEDKARRRP